MFHFWVGFFLVGVCFFFLSFFFGFFSFLFILIFWVGVGFFFFGCVTLINHFSMLYVNYWDSWDMKCNLKLSSIHWNM